MVGMIAHRGRIKKETPRLWDRSWRHSGGKYWDRDRVPFAWCWDEHQEQAPIPFNYVDFRVFRLASTSLSWPYNVFIGRPGKILSIGQNQRFALFGNVLVSLCMCLLQSILALESHRRRI